MSGGPLLGIDFGASNIRAAIGDPNRVLGFARRPTPATADAIGAAIRETVRTVAGDADVDPTDVSAAGVAVAGPLDRTAGVVRPVNVHAESVPIRREVREVIGDGTVRLVNDAAAGALAERDAADGSQQLVYITISTGIGVGVIADGRLLSGHQGNAGELGHVVVDEQGRLTCGCGAQGHWEAYCSGEGLPQFAGLLAQTTELDTELSLAELDARTLFEHAESDPLAAATLERASAYNATGVATAVLGYAPERVVFGGGVALAHPETTLAPIRERLPELLHVEPPELGVTEYGDRVGVRGALVAAAGV